MPQGGGQRDGRSPSQNLVRTKGLPLKQRQGGNIQEEDTSALGAQGRHVPSTHQQDHCDAGKAGGATVGAEGRRVRLGAWPPDEQSAEGAGPLLSAHSGPRALARPTVEWAGALGRQQWRLRAPQLARSIIHQDVGGWRGIKTGPKSGARPSASHPPEGTAGLSPRARGCSTRPPAHRHLPDLAGGPWVAPPRRPGDPGSPPPCTWAGRWGVTQHQQDKSLTEPDKTCDLKVSPTLATSARTGWPAAEASSLSPGVQAHCLPAPQWCPSTDPPCSPGAQPEPPSNTAKSTEHRPRGQPPVPTASFRAASSRLPPGPVAVAGQVLPYLAPSKPGRVGGWKLRASSRWAQPLR